MSSLLLPHPSHPFGSYQPGSVDPALLRQPLSLRSLGKQTPDATAQVPAKPWPHLLCATAPHGRADGHQPGTQQPPIRQLVAPMCVLWHSSMRQPAVHSSFGHGRRPSPQLRCVLKLWLVTLSLVSYCFASLRSVAMVAPILLPGSMLPRTFLRSAWTVCFPASPCNVNLYVHMPYFKTNM